MTAAVGSSISVVVISHNYEEYLATAIDSALAQSYPVEVLVVDDGSTDRSRDVLATYKGRVRSLLKSNGGNSSVVNAALALTHGEIVIFLDADDILYPDAAMEVAAAWTPYCAKVQFRLSLLDGAGTVIGVDPPARSRMPTGDVVPQLLVTGSYVTPVTTGNAFRRSVLEQLLPIPVDDFRNTNDGYLNALCPFYGWVISVDRELGGYRLHGRNLWAFSAAVDLPGVRQRLAHDLTRHRYLSDAAYLHGYDRPDDLMLRDPVHTLLRLASLRYSPSDHPVPTDRTLPLTRAGLLAVARDNQSERLQRVLTGVALLGVATLPQSFALRICDLALTSRPRPTWVRFTARTLRRILGGMPSAGQL